MKGRQIKTLRGLADLAKRSRSVTGKQCWFNRRKSMPAIFLLNMQGFRIYKALKEGIYEYKPIKTKKRKWYDNSNRKI